MKRTALSLGLLLSLTLHCMDDVVEVPFKTVLERKDADGNTILHYVIGHCATVNNLKKSANPVFFKNTFFDKKLRHIQNVDEIPSEKQIRYANIQMAVGAQVLSKTLTDAGVNTVPEYGKKATTKITTIIDHLHGLNFDLNIQNNAGETALFLTVQYEAPKAIVKKLLELGANPNICTLKGISPFMIAVTKKHNKGTTKLLLKYNADPSEFFRNQTDTVPVSHCIAQASLDSTNALLAHFNNIDSKERDKLAQKGAQLTLTPSSTSSNESEYQSAGTSKEEDSNDDNDNKKSDNGLVALDEATQATNESMQENGRRTMAAIKNLLREKSPFYQ